MQGCNQYVTVWNRWRNPDGNQSADVFYRHILPVRCKYKTRVTRTATKEGVAVGNTQLVIVPESDMYRNPNEWEYMEEDDRKKYFTFQEGDIVALGAILFDITGNAPWREADVRKRLKPDVFSIQSIRDNTRDKRGRHFKVEGT